MDYNNRIKTVAQKREQKKFFLKTSQKENFQLLLKYHSLLERNRDEVELLLARAKQDG